jgi:energy-coupling factor transporter ATP-binding protein EcfA2
MKPLIESLHIRSFRGLKDVHLESMGRFNLLVGENNSGKTSILETIMLMLRPSDARQWLKILNIRDIDLANTNLGEAVSWLFPVVGRISPGQRQDVLLEGVIKGANEGLRFHFLRESPMLISPPAKTRLEEEMGYSTDEALKGRQGVLLLGEWFSQVSGNISGTVLFPDYEGRLGLPKVNDAIRRVRRYPVSFVKPHSHRVTRLAFGALTNEVFQKRKQLVIGVLQSFDPDITGVEMVEVQRGSTVVIEHRVLGAMPLHSYGDGVRKAFVVIGHALRAEGGVLILDEAETALHIRAQEDFFSTLMKLCTELNVQIVATTHSLDTVDAVLKAMPEHNSDFVGYHLSASDGTRKVKRYSGDLWERLRFERGLDIR